MTRVINNLSLLVELTATALPTPTLLRWLCSASTNKQLYLAHAEGQLSHPDYTCLQLGTGDVDLVPRDHRHLVGRSSCSYQKPAAKKPISALK